MGAPRRSSVQGSLPARPVRVRSRPRVQHLVPYAIMNTSPNRPPLVRAASAAFALAALAALAPAQKVAMKASLDGALKGFQQTGGDVRELLFNVVRSDAFRHQRVQ